MQYERGLGTGKDNFEILGELPSKNIDTGMGLERVAFLMQSVENLYEIDQVRPVLDLAAKLSGKTYGDNLDDDIRLRVVADHVRSALMLIGDGVSPGNDGRGYVLRRLLRRTVRAMRLLGVNEPVFGQLFTTSKNAMVDAYPELENEFKRIHTTVLAEEEAFLRTLTSGTQVLESAIEQAVKAGEKVLSGETSFLLHDTYGFPIDLTVEIAEENSLSVDREAFTALMAEQKNRAKADAKMKKAGNTDLSVYGDFRMQGTTKFTGYEDLVTSAKVMGIIADGEQVQKASVGNIVEVILDETSFYAESGGQIADAGTIHADGLILEVLDVQKPVKGLVSHKSIIRQGELGVGTTVTTSVDADWRLGAAQAHSATHVVHAALRQALGPTALQSGSYNKPGYMRLDFSWTSALSSETKSEIEEIANLAIRADLAVSAQFMTLPEAREWGAVALFGETYDESVRVVQIGGPWSRELCGGTHVSRSSQIGLVSITNESSVGSGSRRLEALVGMEALRALTQERVLLHKIAEQLKSTPLLASEKLELLLSEVKEMQRTIAQAEGQKLATLVPELLKTTQSIGSFTTLFSVIKTVSSVDALRDLAIKLRDELGENASVIALAAVIEGKPALIVTANPAAQKQGAKAGDLVRLGSQVLGGGGGGKADIAQGGGTDSSKIADALQAVLESLR
jgi:alanyl-tRNA synthetase